MAAAIDKLRAALQEHPPTKLIVAEKPTAALGGRWEFADREGYVSISHARQFRFQDDRETSIARDGVFHWCVLRIAGFFIEACIICRKECSGHPLSTNSQRLRLEVSLEQILHINLFRFPTVELCDRDRERVALFFREPLHRYLAIWADQEMRAQPVGFQRNASIECRLSENWRDPSRAISEFHQHLANALKSYSPERMSTIDCASYDKEVVSNKIVYRSVAEPDVRVTLPMRDREFPRYFPGVVSLGERNVCIDVDCLPLSKLSENFDTFQSTSKVLALYALTHPFSTRVRPWSERPVWLDPSTADRAIQYMGDAFLADLKSRQSTHVSVFAIDVVVI